MQNQKLTRAEAARINGAKSRGPTSPEGKARSSRNAIKHGLSAKQFMVSPDEQEEFDNHLTAAICHWAPQSDYELYLVTKLARAEFLHDRAENIQTTLIDLETDIIGPEVARAFQTMDAIGAVSLGYKSLDDHSTAHRNMDRHLARLGRERIQARKALLEAIDYRRQLEAEEASLAEPEPTPVPEPVAVQNEPIGPVPQPEVTLIDTPRRPAWHPVNQPNGNAMQNEPIEPAGDTPFYPAA